MCGMLKRLLRNYSKSGLVKLGLIELSRSLEEHRKRRKPVRLPLARAGDSHGCRERVCSRPLPFWSNLDLIYLHGIFIACSIEKYSWEVGIFLGR